jgi:NAD-dependent dihydropyrimidine dehydrogenase PreA subunit
LGEALLDPATLVRQDAGVVVAVAVARNDRCLAQRGGCFSCLESCPQEAIALGLGSGVRIDEERCTGCGSCVAICPVTPKALAVTPVQTK